MSKFSLSNFGDLLAAEFPELDEEFKEFAGLPYIQMALSPGLCNTLKAKEIGKDTERRRRLLISFGLARMMSFATPSTFHSWSTLISKDRAGLTLGRC